jgi:putative intracellular protease/amidase
LWLLFSLILSNISFDQAGYEVDLVSINGGHCPVSPSSLNLNDADNKEFWENPDLKALTENTKKLSDVDVSQYDIFFLVGGYGTMWDFPFDETVASSIRQVYEKNGVVGGVCHGPIGLANVKLSNGEYLVAGKDVTAFCNEEESFIPDLASVLPNHPQEELAGKRTCEDILSVRGANFTKTSPWGAHVAKADRLFTGQNPASAGPVAEAIIESLAH